MNNYDKYAEFTREHDWSGICKLNDAGDSWNIDKKELKALPKYLETDEVVFAITSGNMGQAYTSGNINYGLKRWLVVLTNEKFLFLNAAMMIGPVDTQSIRHEHVQAVSASQRWVYGEMMIELGNRKVGVDNCIKKTVKVMADLANEWLKELGKKKNTEKPSAEFVVEEIKVADEFMNNYDKYAEFTKEHDWSGICILNDAVYDSIGVTKEFEALPNYLDDDEVVFAITSGLMGQTSTSNYIDFGLNTWLVVLTNERFLFLDAALMTSSVDTQSIRHEHVQAVSASQGWTYGEIMIDLGSRTVGVDNCDKKTVKVMADLANKWLKELGKKKNTEKLSTEHVVEESQLDKLEKLAKLHSIGALTEEEFKAAKEKILSSL